MTERTRINSFEKQNTKNGNHLESEKSGIHISKKFIDFESYRVQNKREKSLESRAQRGRNCFDLNNNFVLNDSKFNKKSSQCRNVFPYKFEKKFGLKNVIYPEFPLANTFMPNGHFKKKGKKESKLKFQSLGEINQVNYLKDKSGDRKSSNLQMHTNFVEQREWKQRQQHWESPREAHCNRMGASVSSKRPFEQFIGEVNL